MNDYKSFRTSSTGNSYGQFSTGNMDELTNQLDTKPHYKTLEDAYVVLSTTNKILEAEKKELQNQMFKKDLAIQDLEAITNLIDTRMSSHNDEIIRRIEEKHDITEKKVMDIKKILNKNISEIHEKQFKEWAETSKKIYIFGSKNSRVAFMVIVWCFTIISTIVLLKGVLVTGHEILKFIMK